MNITTTDPCGCRHSTDKHGRERVAQCARHAEETRVRHLAAIESCSHIDRARRETTLGCAPACTAPTEADCVRDGRSCIEAQS